MPVLFKVDIASYYDRIRQGVVIMGRLTVKEKIFYRFILCEKLVYKHWYTRFLICGVDLARIRRVISRIKNFYTWCDEWAKEGEMLCKMAEGALLNGDTYIAIGESPAPLEMVVSVILRRRWLRKLTPSGQKVYCT